MSVPSPYSLALRMAELARVVAVPRDLDEVLADVTAAAVELIPGADIADVMLVDRNGVHWSKGATGALPQRLTKLQEQYGEGPCAEAAKGDTLVRTDDFGTDSRWPRYSPEAVKLGVRSGLSLKLFTADRTAGALNLFGFATDGFDIEAETIGTVLAAHAAAAIMAARNQEQLTSALSNRDRIGQAKGMIMERYMVDEVRAFEILRQLSQESNVKLVDIATRVIETRDRS
jgi:GAF domain-containing protein